MVLLSSVFTAAGLCLWGSLIKHRSVSEFYCDEKPAIQDNSKDH